MSRRQLRSFREPRRAVALLSLALGLVYPLSPSAQEAPSQAPPPIAAVPTPQIAVQADRATRTLRAFEESLAPGPVAERIAEGLPRVSERLALQEQRSEKALQSPSLDGLDALESEWTSLGLALPTWQEQLTRRITEVEEALSRLATLEQVWRATREAASQDATPGPVLERVTGVLEGIARTRERALARRSALLTLQAGVAAELGRVEGAVASLGALRQQLVGRTFERNGTPIWSPELHAQMTDVLGSGVGQAFADQREELASFVRTQRDGLALQAGLFVVLVFLLRSARRRVRRRTEEEEGLGSVAEVFELPVSMALLLTLLSGPWFFPHLPPVVVQILGAAALVPTVLILRRITASALYPLLNALIVFYFFDRLRELADPLPTLARALFLVEMLGGLLLLVWFMRPSRLAGLSSSQARSQTLRAMGFAGRAGIFLFSGAFLANALGYLRLGDLVGGALLESGYVAVVAYAGVQILDSLVTLALRVRPLGALGIVKRSRYAMRRRTHRVLVLGAILAWVVVTLEIVSIRAPLFEAIHRGLVAELTVGAISISLGDVLAFVLTIWFSFLLSRFVRLVLEADIFPRLQLARGVPYAMSTFAHYTILLLGFFLAVAATGMDLNRFALLAGAFGVGIGFGLQNVVNNFVSGLILLSERPVQVGDTIEAGDALGEVRRIGIRSSTVRTWSGAELIVPNSQLISERVINWTLSDRQRRIDVPVGVAYGTNLERMLALLLEVARGHESILEQPEPAALFVGFGDSSLDFELRAWTGELKDFMRIRSDLSVAIGLAMDEAGIEVPFPQRDLHLRSVDERAARLLTDGDAAER